jgi:spermidine synthase
VELVSNQRVAAPIYLAATVLAGCSILYELTIAQTISLLAANTVIWYSVTVGLFLLGLGLGAFLSTRIQAKWAPWKALFLVEIVLITLGALSVPILHSAHILLTYNYLADSLIVGNTIFLSASFLLVLSIGTLTGIELPILISIGKKSGIKHATGVLLGFDYVGSLVGALAFPILLLPFFEPLAIGFGVAALNATIALAIASTVLVTARIPAILVTMSLVFALIATSFQFDSIHQYFLKRYFYYIELGGSLSTLFGPDESQPKVFHASSPYQKINLVADNLESRANLVRPLMSRKHSFSEFDDYPHNQILTLDGKFQFNSSTEEIYHEYFAHVPIIATGKIPQKVLVLGGGDGLLIRELLKYPDLSIRHVDLDATLLALSKTHPALRRMNQNALTDKRVHTTAGDGYHFVRHDNETYDAIFIDFPFPMDYNLARLYSREFFYYVRKHLKADGFAVFDSTGTDKISKPDTNGQQTIQSDNNWPIYYNTLRAAGFDNDQIYPFLTTLNFDHDRMKQIYLQSGIVEYLENLLAKQIEESSNNTATRVPTTHEMVEIYVNHTKRSLVRRHQHGFILLTAEDARVSKSYKDYNIEMYVLDASRYKLAFQFEYPFENVIRQELVNSVFRPTFPSDPVWQAKLPY